MTLPEEQQRTAGKVADLAVPGTKQLLPSWAIFLSNVHLAALVQERRKQMVVFTQGWDVFRVSEIEEQMSKEEECVHGNNCGGLWICKWPRRE